MLFEAAAGALLMAAGSGYAITVSGLNPNSSSFVAAPALDSPYSGVAELLIVRSDLGPGAVEGCSGALLADGVSILTSAGCIADANGVNQATAAYVMFTTADGVFTTEAVTFTVDPSFNGSETSPNDVAILTLASAAPDDVTRYSLYTGDPSDQSITLAGYGFGGNGSVGYDPADYPFGTLREGQNQYQSGSATGDLTFVFNDPTTDPGAPADEAFIAPGDAGGPSFIDGEIAGVHSYFTGGNLNSSYGETGEDAGVSYNLAFIESEVLTPEPNLMIVLGIALVVISLSGSKRRHP
jgi:hypothetical protein